MDKNWGGGVDIITALTIMMQHGASKLYDGKGEE